MAGLPDNLLNIVGALAFLVLAMALSNWITTRVIRGTVRGLAVKQSSMNTLYENQLRDRKMRHILNNMRIAVCGGTPFFIGDFDEDDEAVASLN